jgi:hypothetical protein
MTYAPVHVDVDVNYGLDPDQGEASMGATVLVCSENDEYRLVDVDDDPGWVTVWTRNGADESEGSRKTTAGCGSDESEPESPVEVTVWVDQRPWGIV